MLEPGVALNPGRASRGTRSGRWDTMIGRASGPRGSTAHRLCSAAVEAGSAAGTEEAMSEENLSTQQPQEGQATRFPPPHVDSGRSGDHQVPATQGPPPPVGLIWRVDRRDTFEALRRGRRHSHGPITVSWVAGDPAEPPRVAYTIGRGVGPAVVRNRVRRRLRMLIREAAPKLRPGAYLIGVRPPAVLLKYDELQEALSKVLRYFETS
jgi:ribonuclease P protein component